MNQTVSPGKWYHYLAAFFAGAFLANAVPHYVSGVMGNPFPSPFADPPGKGLSSPLVNVFWGLSNLLVGYLLWRAGKMNSKTTARLLTAAIAFVAMSAMLALTFVDKQAS